MITVAPPQRGVVLIAVLIALLVLAATALLVAESTNMDQARLSSQGANDTLHYLTAAGRRHARWQLAQNSTCSDFGSVPVTAFGGHSYSASITPAAGSPVRISATGTLADGSSRTQAIDGVRSYEQPATLVLQPGPAAGKDTFIYEWQPTRNHGSQAYLDGGDFGTWSQMNPLLQFDLSAIPGDVRIISATLELYQVQSGNSSAELPLYRITSSWTEGSDTGGAGGSPSGVTWNERSPATPWSNPGGDLDPVAVSSTFVGNAVGWYEWDVRQLVAGWTAGNYPNHGLALARPPVAGSARFASSDNTNATLRPRLTIVYACECGSACVAGGGPVSPYTEAHAPWSASSSDTWQTVDLSGFGVPAGAVLEVAIANSNGSSDESGGVRAVGSPFDRRISLHEAEAGGVEVVIAHVQADASGRIEHYAENRNYVSFVLLGYWEGSSYVERAMSLETDDDQTWESVPLGAFGIPANAVVEVLIVNTNPEREREGGVRSPGSTLDRRLSLHEAESGGIDGVTVLAATDSNARLEFYAERDEEVGFYIVGYWDNPPGNYVEAMTPLGTVATAGTWVTTDVGSLGVPPAAIAQIVTQNGDPYLESGMGARSFGAGLPRILELHEAESGGSDFAGMHVNVDLAGRIERFDASPANHEFWLVGWWEIP